MLLFKYPNVQYHPLAKLKINQKNISKASEHKVTQGKFSF
jgi:hypothetical protein